LRRETHIERLKKPARGLCRHGENQPLGFQRLFTPRPAQADTKTRCLGFLAAVERFDTGNFRAAGQTLPQSRGNCPNERFIAFTKCLQRSLFRWC